MKKPQYTYSAKLIAQIYMLFLLFIPCLSYAVDSGKSNLMHNSKKTINYVADKQKLEKIISSKDSPNYYHACFLLANYYHESRKGIPQDKIKAREYYNLALEASMPKANEGIAEYQYVVAISTKRAKFNSKLAYEWLLKSATQGYVPAQATIAFWYMKGIGIDKPDIEQAADWARKASNQGNMLGRALLGAYYVNVKKDIPYGIKLIEESANAGNAGGQYMLYRCLYIGKGLEKDQKKAMELLQQAADQGLDDAVTKLRILNRRKTDTQM